MSLIDVGLNLRRQVEQTHELADPRSAQTLIGGDLRSGARLATVEPSLEVPSPVEVALDGCPTLPPGLDG